jgi:multicomponent Na+:H+ antiporter subunit C
MNPTMVSGLLASGLVGLGLYGLITHPDPLRKLLGFDLMGGGIFLVFGIVARRGGTAGLPADPVPHALVITGIVVAFAATALGVALILRLRDEAGVVTLDPDADPPPHGPTK